MNDLDKLDIIILKLCEKEHLTNTQITDMIKKSKRTSRYRISKLVDLGLLGKYPNLHDLRGSYYYTIIPEEEPDIVDVIMSDINADQKNLS